jgi:hypothetical protein
MSKNLFLRQRAQKSQNLWVFSPLSVPALNHQLSTINSQPSTLNQKPTWGFLLPTVTDAQDFIPNPPFVKFSSIRMVRTLYGTPPGSDNVINSSCFRTPLRACVSEGS